MVVSSNNEFSIINVIETSIQFLEVFKCIARSNKYVDHVTRNIILLTINNVAWNYRNEKMHDGM